MRLIGNFKLETSQVIQDDAASSSYIVAIVEKNPAGWEAGWAEASISEEGRRVLRTSKAQFVSTDY